MRFFVIGGAGYVGSHFVHEAKRQGHSCLVYDNLQRGHEASVPAGTELIIADIRAKDKLAQALKTYAPDVVLHYAAYALVGESVAQPELYYDNNVAGTKTLLDVLAHSGRRTPLVFSSTCAVFGVPSSLPIREDDEKRPCSPYGRTKLACEHMIEDYAKAYGFSAAALRYFNACGADADGGIGEAHEPETHLIPNIFRAVRAGEPVRIFGRDFPTPDGTCVRDFIHVADLAEAHLLAAQYLLRQPSGGFFAAHLGTGLGRSNLDVVRAAERVVGRTIAVTYGERRAGDPPSLYADNSRARELLGFVPRRSGLDEILSSAWRWHSQ